LIWNQRHLERVLSEYLEHYNTGRPHRGIDLEVLVRAPVAMIAPPSLGGVKRDDLLGGLIHEYRRAA
jgi:putative transposase